jgi:hypothetical protein
MEFGKCKLCLLDKPLCESHLIPESLYAHVREGEESPIRVGDGVVMPTDRHMTTYLLCSLRRSQGRFDSKNERPNS